MVCDCVVDVFGFELWIKISSCVIESVELIWDFWIGGFVWFSSRLGGFVFVILCLVFFVVGCCVLLWLCRWGMNVLLFFFGVYVWGWVF